MKSLLVTGGAGFIGSHVIEALLEQPDVTITCVDNFDDFYDPSLKWINIAGFLGHPRFRLVEADITDLALLEAGLPGPYQSVIHLAAKAGVRRSIEQAVECYTANVLGTQNVLEIAKRRGVKQFVFGSSSSVYGTNARVPWRENDTDFRPISPYAATKVSGEMLGHVYAHLYSIRVVVLRFFTVFGPRQRPDLVIHKFAQLMHEGKAIPFYGDGATRRDYTYVGDIVQGILAALQYQDSPYEVINLGNSQTVTLAELVETLEAVTGKKALLHRLPPQPGDVPQTYADISKAKTLLGYQPRVSLRAGLENFNQWFLQQQSTIQAV